MTNKASLRSIVGVNVSSCKAQSFVPGVGCCLILGTTTEISLSRLASSDSVVGSTADVDELITDAVEDDVGVESLLLTLVHNGVLGLEGELASLASIERLLKLDSRSAGSKVKTERGSLETIDCKELSVYVEFCGTVGIFERSEEHTSELQSLRESRMPSSA